MTRDFRECSGRVMPYDREGVTMPQGCATTGLSPMPRLGSSQPQPKPGGRCRDIVAVLQLYAQPCGLNTLSFSHPVQIIYKPQHPMNFHVS
jgi:hypothetical protein